MRGFDLRYQNGFDCQGLWIEVEVEKELGFKSKKDIESYGIAEFIKRCKQRVLRYAAVQVEQSIRLGYWMDWLRNMGEWMISKKRYWGLALPIWECPNCEGFVYIYCSYF